MAINLGLNSEKILEKVFPASEHGYDSLEVDTFLDQIIQDYRLIENAKEDDGKINALNAKISSLEEKIKNLEIENEKYKNRFAYIKENDNVTLDNIELVRKINKYESFLYKLGYNPHTIK